MMKNIKGRGERQKMFPKSTPNVKYQVVDQQVNQRIRHNHS